MALKKFRFSLETLKTLRQNRLYLAQRELSLIQGKKSELIEKKEKAILDRQEYIREGNNFANTMGLGSSAFILGLTQNLRLFESNIFDIDAEIERQMSWLAHLGKELKIIEKLEEKKREEFLFEQKKLEKRQANQWVAERWAFSRSGEEI